MKLEVGMYVRNKDGIIDKVILNYNGKCASPNCNCKHVSCEKDYYDEENIIKAGHNIIDLIEVGDYVNGCKVIKVNLELPLKYVKCINDNSFKESEIKTILTKEQFENNCYKIGE